LFSRIIQVAREEKLSRVSSEMLRDNLAMQIMSKHLGFQLSSYDEGEAIKAVLEL
jgi:hypothetical protein